MTRLLVLLNNIDHTSIPFETTLRIAEKDGIEVTIASLYDDDLADLNVKRCDRELSVEILTLGGDSRLDRMAWSAFRRALKNQYDIVHTHHNFSGSVARVLSNLEGIPVVNTEHRDHGSFSPLQNVVNAPTLPLADRIVSNSQVTQNSFRWYERLLIDHDKLEIVHNGVDTERIEKVISDTKNPEDDTLRVCTAARMVPVKNQSALVRAFDSVVDQHPNSELIFLGDGPLRGDLEQLTNDLKLTDNVQFSGEVSRERVYEVFAQSDVFAIPSHAEGFCVAAVEAMASGLPVVASDIPIFHEVVKDGGVLADQTNPEEVARAILELKENEGKYQKVSTSAKQRATTKFSLDKCVDAYYEIYKDVLEENK
ncbi:glycosyltransferase family 4 protein [Halorubrum ezzemoulense]|uniref:glycosyltransferase family 4 protein n=1 Tax=Halorubrum ezzemoulense TaxID=337243 RepID=UPI00232A935B|nr:glycosyltransferase family 4 protein [Halorubrum ezzemoulense]MDB2286707.1 glycosyltransferase family 4 protein [Halorubrum ezzemoulense]